MHKASFKNQTINVFSEIGRLRKVLVKRPGYELRWISPQTKDELLFSAIINLDAARKEHDEFCKILRDNGVDVVYLEDLLIETWNYASETERKDFIKLFIEESGVTDNNIKKKMFDFLIAKSTYGLVKSMIKGITEKELRISQNEDVLVVQPMPNAYFTRDPFSCVGNSIILSAMEYKIRDRETIFARFIFKCHPDYKNVNVISKWNNSAITKIEGGDIFIYNDKTLVIGVSARTNLDTIIAVAKELKKDKNNTFEEIIAINVPKKWNLMHLDTWLVMVDKNKFIYSPNISKDLDFWKINLLQKKVVAEKFNKSLEEVLEYIIKQEPELIPVADNYSQLKIDVETHFDATNFLVIKPGVVVGYDRNQFTISALRKHGVEVLTFYGDQLSLGMGSSRCMSMPLQRDHITIK